MTLSPLTIIITITVWASLLQLGAEAPRGNAVALGVAGAVFADIPEATVAIVLFGTLVSLLVPATALLLRRLPSAERGVTSGRVASPFV